MEHVQLLYLVTAILSGYLFVIFLWWWLSEGSPTPIYKITCGLMFGLCISSAGSWYLYHRYFNGDSLTDIYNWYMHIKQYFIIIPLIAYCSHVTKKFFRLDERRRQNTGMRRRITDK